jgi:type IV pilus assembly protein PilW
MRAITFPSRRTQSGLTLIEFMVSIGLGMILVAALATLIANQSTNRAEVERAGRLIENGRFAIRTMADDVQMAGYWGELNAATPGVVAIPDPCSTTVADIDAALAVHVQGYDSPASGSVPSCVSHYKSGTDILVIRRADPDSAALETANVTDFTKLTNGQVYIQTGLVAATGNFSYILKAGSASNAADFTLKKKDLATTATVRRFLVHIYYVSTCSVPAGSSCTNGDGGNPIPTLKMVELTSSGWNTVTIAEGIENMQLDYGKDIDGDGIPNSVDLSGNTTNFANAADWTNAMSVKIHLLARSPELTPGYVDDKTYSLGTGGTIAATSDGYKRHVFTQTVRMVNPSARRM